MLEPHVVGTICYRSPGARELADIALAGIALQHSKVRVVMPKENSEQ